MLSVMSAGDSGGLESTSEREMEVMGDEPTLASTSVVVGDSESAFRFHSVGSTEEAAGVSLTNADRPGESKVADDIKEAELLKRENTEARFIDTSGGTLGKQPGASLTSGHRNGKKNSSRNVKLENKKMKLPMEDYDSILTAFDEYAAKGKGEVVGYGYQIGDMVWGKVKSHPWWPGHIYNEAFASPSVRRSKREGHVLVAFFGDSSYGWFDPAELIPFEENFAEKSRQTFSKSFFKAVEEAVDELSKRRSLGLACRCRNEFNFWPSSVEGYFVVDVGDYEPGVYSLSQINKARDNFQPREMLSFVQQLALTPMNDQQWTIPFMKNKATVLACRKALFEEFDETYAQAFGTMPVRPSRPTAPVAVDPSKAPLSGRLVIAEALGKEKISMKTMKTKDQVEKDKYLFKRRDEPKIKKANAGQVALSSEQHLVDGFGVPENITYSSIGDRMQHTSDSGVTDVQHPPTSDLAAVASDINPSEGSRRLVEGGKKKTKSPKRSVGELSSDDVNLVEKKKRKKRKKERNPETNSEIGTAAVANNGVSMDKIPVPPLHDPVSDGNQSDNRKEGTMSSSPGADEGQKAELLMLLRDLRSLALNPFHGRDRYGPAIIRQVFWKYRSLVYKKSLTVLPPTDNECGESGSRSSAATASISPSDKAIEKPSVKLVKPSVRPDDPTKGGRKSGSPEDVKKKRKVDDLEGIKKKKKLSGGEDIRMKKMEDMKLQAAERKASLKSSDSERVDVKEIAAKNGPSALRKTVKLEPPMKRVEQSVRVPRPTMLVMKFRDGAALPSGAELRAKFARFGPLDHSATRVFWKSYTCRLVYHYKIDAEAALKFAAGSGILFGNSNVRCHIREMGGGEAPDSEPIIRTQREDISDWVASHSRDSPVVEQRMTTTGPTLQLQQSVLQLKSCLKKPSGDEGVNGGGRGIRVKFAPMSGEESSKSEPPLLSSGNRNINKIASFPEEASSSSTNTLDASSKNIPKFIPQSGISLASSSHFQKFPMNMPSSEQMPRLFNAPPPPPPPPIQQLVPSAQPPPQPPQTKDVSQQMLNLLTRCSDLVSNLTGVLGYVPYHPL